MSISLNITGAFQHAQHSYELFLAAASYTLREGKASWNILQLDPLRIQPTLLEEQDKQVEVCGKLILKYKNPSTLGNTVNVRVYLIRNDLEKDLLFEGNVNTGVTNTYNWLSVPFSRVVDTQEHLGMYIIASAPLELHSTDCQLKVKVQQAK